MANFEVILSIVKTEDGRPVNPGELIVLHVDRQDVVPPVGWTRNAAKGATGTFFWRIADVNEPTQIALSAPGPFTADCMSLYARPVRRA